MATAESSTTRRSGCEVWLEAERLPLVCLDPIHQHSRQSVGARVAADHDEAMVVVAEQSWQGRYRSVAHALIAIIFRGIAIQLCATGGEDVTCAPHVAVDFDWHVVMGKRGPRVGEQIVACPIRHGFCSVVDEPAAPPESHHEASRPGHGIVGWYILRGVRRPCRRPPLVGPVLGALHGSARGACASRWCGGATCSQARCARGASARCMGRATTTDACGRRTSTGGSRVG